MQCDAIWVWSLLRRGDGLSWCCCEARRDAAVTGTKGGLLARRTRGCMHK